MKKNFLLLLMVMNAIICNAQRLYDHGGLTDSKYRFSLEGSKWNKVNLKYYFINGTRHLSNNVAHNAVKEAFAIWAGNSVLTFTEVSSRDQADIKISWSTGNHGDGDQNSFDGNSGVLAHAYYPYPAGGRYAGELHFDDDEIWTTNGVGVDLTTVALHEIGHLLGIQHTDDTQAIMQPFYNGPNRHLGLDDLLAIWNLYKNPYSISGPTSLQIPTSATYTIGKIPLGARVEWSTDPLNSASITSGQGTATATFSINSSNINKIQANIVYDQGHEYTLPSLNIKAAKEPIISDIEIFQYCQSDGEYTLKAILSDPNATCTWSSDGYLYDILYPNDVSFIEHPNLFKAIDFYSTGYHNISVNATNRFGTSTYNKTIYINTAKRSYTVSLYPNPATSNYVTLQIKEIEQIPPVSDKRYTTSNKYKVLLWSTSSLIKTIESDQPTIQIPLYGLAAGQYFIHILKDGEIHKKQLIIK